MNISLRLRSACRPQPAPPVGHLLLSSRLYRSRLSGGLTPSTPPTSSPGTCPGAGYAPAFRFHADRGPFLPPASRHRRRSETPPERAIADLFHGKGSRLPTVSEEPSIRVSRFAPRRAFLGETRLVPPRAGGRRASRGGKLALEASLRLSAGMFSREGRFEDCASSSTAGGRSARRVRRSGGRGAECTLRVLPAAARRAHSFGDQVPQNRCDVVGIRREEGPTMRPTGRCARRGTILAIGTERSSASSTAKGLEKTEARRLLEPSRGISFLPRGRIRPDRFYDRRRDESWVGLTVVGISRGRLAARPTRRSQTETSSRGGGADHPEPSRGRASRGRRGRA
jgi:hypothetical protein